MNGLQNNLLIALNQRRIALEMTFPALASRSGVPESTVKRILGRCDQESSFEKVEAIAKALGMPLACDPIDIDEYRKQAAREKAVRIAKMVQGTSALEAQAVGSDQYERLIDRSYHELLSGSPRRLWSA